MLPSRKACNNYEKIKVTVLSSWVQSVVMDSNKRLRRKGFDFKRVRELVRVRVATHTSTCTHKLYKEVSSSNVIILDLELDIRIVYT